MDITGGCHCGNISFTLDWPGDAAEIPARSCGCSFCQKHGGVWTSRPDAALRVRIHDAGAVSRYVFGTGTAEFLVCASCGVTPLVTSRIEDRTYAVVNVNTFENVERARLRATPASFEGEEVGARLERRKRNWIARVVLLEGNS
jgi:hypothetical protein